MTADKYIGLSLVPVDCVPGYDPGERPSTKLCVFRALSRNDGNGSCPHGCSLSQNRRVAASRWRAAAAAGSHCVRIPRNDGNRLIIRQNSIGEIGYKSLWLLRLTVADLDKPEYVIYFGREKTCKVWLSRLQVALGF